MELVIDGIDFTTCVVHGTYNINEEKQYVEWVNGNMITIRKEIRSRIVGTVSLHLRDRNDLKSWRNVWKTKHDNSCYRVRCSVNNTGDTKLIDAFLECAPIRESRGTLDTLAEFELSVREA